MTKPTHELGKSFADDQLKSWYTIEVRYHNFAYFCDKDNTSSIIKFPKTIILSKLLTDLPSFFRHTLDLNQLLHRDYSDHVLE